MRSWLLIAKLACLAVAAALVVVSDGSAAPTVVTVAITASGPSPSTLRIRPGEEWGFVNHDSVPHKLVFRTAHGTSYCNLNAEGEPPPTVAPCDFGTAVRVGTYSYSVDGRFPGKIVVVALSRSVSLTARRHSVRLGSALTLHGQERFDKRAVIAACNGGSRDVLRLLARHATGKPFKRIAMIHAAHPHTSPPGTNGCSLRWQLQVRPGITTSYIIQTEPGGWFKQAASEPFTVMIRP